VGLFNDWCGQQESKENRKHLWILIEKAGGRDAIRGRLAETMRSHYERLDRIADDVARLGYEGAAELLRTVLPRKARARSGELGLARTPPATNQIRAAVHCQLEEFVVRRIVAGSQS
jgi:hypothetical protein